MSSNVRFGFVVAVVLAGTSILVAQRRTEPTSNGIDVAAALQTVVPDLDKRLSQFKQVRMPYDASHLTPRERQMIDQLVIASQDLESIYWRQSDPDGLSLYKALTPERTPVVADRTSIRFDPSSLLVANLRRYLIINGSRFDLVDQNKPFVGHMAMPPGRALYPADLTKAEVDAYVSAHPDKRADIYNPYKVVHRAGRELVGRYYHDEYQAYVSRAAEALRKAADFSSDAAFADFLRLRADALLIDDYYKSDLAWVSLENPKFDVIFAPYETYLDDLLGVKTSYGAAILIRNEAETSKLAVFEKWVPDIQEALPIAAEDRPSVRGHVAPMEVMDTPYRAGDLRHGYQAVADNLPNDPRIHREKGAKHIFFKNFMDARVNEVILPLASHLMDAAQARVASANGYLTHTVMHEICHGLGPSYARQNGRQVDIREAIGPSYSGLEEAKADVVGIFALKWLVDRGVLPKERLEEYYASYVAGIFRTIRYGTGEAHGRAEMMEFRYLSERGAIVRNGSRYHIEYPKMPSALDALAKELLEQEATGNRARTEAWFTKYDRMPPDLATALASAREVPIDVDPVFSIPERID